MSYIVEQRWTGLRMIADRCRLFAVLAGVAGVAVGGLWVWAISLDAGGRASLGPYLYVSWLATDDNREPVTLTYGGKRLRGTPVVFRETMRKEVYGGRTAGALLEGGLWAAGAGALLTFAALATWGWYPRRDGDEHLVRGPRFYRPVALQRRMILVAVPGFAGRLFRRAFRVAEDDDEL